MKAKSNVTSGMSWGGRSRDMQGCFVEGTQICLADERYVAVETLLPGEPNVMRPDGTPSPLLGGRAGLEEHQVIFFLTDHGHDLGVTQSHPMVVRREGQLSVVAALDVVVEDELLAFNPVDRRFFATVVEVERRDYGGLVYNIEIGGSGDPNSHFIVANGIVTGDLYLQQRLAEKAAGHHTSWAA